MLDYNHLQLVNRETYSSVRATYRYKIKQTDKGAQVAVYGDAIDEIVSDYARLRIKLESEGFKVAPEE